MAQKQTTGATISKLGVLTVLAHNQVPGNEVGPVDHARLIAQIDEIRAGNAGVPAAKVKARSIERCIRGGALMMIGPVGIYGSN